MKLWINKKKSNGGGTWVNFFPGKWKLPFLSLSLLLWLSELIDRRLNFPICRSRPSVRLWSYFSGRTYVAESDYGIARAKGRKNEEHILRISYSLTCLILTVLSLLFVVQFAYMQLARAWEGNTKKHFRKLKRQKLLLQSWKGFKCLISPSFALNPRWNPITGTKLYFYQEKK